MGIQQKGAPIQQLVVGMAYLGKIYIVREETSSKQIILGQLYIDKKPSILVSSFHQRFKCLQFE